ncbi:glycosyltransferase [Altererythrobacter indicus]|uniref:Glycosyltransferase n=1 Tax=Altericroceibacterium indicum TaxID=374177 RepID=A0A845AAU6_9SPHN|nr:glycosyltransferase [Altericroceibacterium indicum]MXP26627.1 glycosyltransferase [Altericroceibacterium indicum]
MQHGRGSERIRILHIIRSTHPAGGGPIAGILLHDEATRNGSDAVQREIVTLDAPQSPWLRTIPMKVHAVGPGSPASLLPLAKLQKYGASGPLREWLKQNAAQFDCAIIHGLWNAANLAARQAFPRLNLPYFVFTHGMLDPWFLQTAHHKYWARRISWKYIEGPLLNRAHAVLFTSEVEMQRARTAFHSPDYHACVVGYGAADPVRHHRIELGKKRQPYLLFLGRLHRKKGIDLLLQALSEMKRDERPHIKIVGPDEEKRLPQFIATTYRLGLSDHITWLGPTFGEEKSTLLREAEAFILPSHQENFGIAVAEALAVGTPVLISNQVAIGESVARAGAGIVAHDTVNGVKSLLLQWQSMPENARYTMRKQARQLFAQQYDVANNAPALVRKLQSLMVGAR